MSDEVRTDEFGTILTTSTKEIPWYAAVNMTLETCAEPGDCGDPATMEVEIEGVPLGFCETHGKRWEAIEAPA